MSRMQQALNAFWLLLIILPNFLHKYMYNRNFLLIILTCSRYFKALCFFCLSNHILFSFYLLIISDYMQPDTIINELIGKLINILMTSFPRTEEDPGLPHIFSGCGCLPTINVSTEIGLGMSWAAIHCGSVCLLIALVTCP